MNKIMEQNKKIEQVVSFLLGKSAKFTVAEINQICTILNSLKAEEKTTSTETTGTE